MEKNINTERGKSFVIAKQVIILGALIGLVFVCIIYGYACWNIRSGVKEISAEAVREYPVERVDALIEYVQSEKHSLKDRNSAVWALGQLGDERALPVLEKFYVGEPCDHDKYLCQRELKHAIGLCKGGLNLCAWVCR